ncbi:MAG: DUF5693 family protein [bacterium]
MIKIKLIERLRGGNRADKLMTLFIFISLAVGLAICGIRISVERKNRDVSIAVDWKAIESFSRLDENRTAMIRELMKAGLSSILIREDTLGSLQSDGKVTLRTGIEVKDYFRTEGILNPNIVWFIKPDDIDNRHLYIMLEDRGIFGRIEERFEKLFGRDSFNIVRDANFYVLELKIEDLSESITPEGLGRTIDEIKRVGLGFDGNAIKTSTEAGAGVILGMGNCAFMSPDTINSAFSEVGDWEHVDGVLFYDSEVTGYPPSDGMLPARENLAPIVRANIQNHLAKVFFDEFQPPKGIREVVPVDEDKLYAVRYHTIREHIGVEQAVNRWVRAARERNVRLLLMPLFQERSKGFDYLKTVRDSLRRNGLHSPPIGDEGIYDNFRVNRLMIILMWPGIVAAALGILKEFVPLKEQVQYSIVLAGTIAVVILMLIGREEIPRQGGALLAAIFFPLLGLVTILDRIEMVEGKPRRGFPALVKRCILLLGLLSSISLIGAAVIVGLLGSADYLLKFDQFRGVKLALAAPPFLAWILVAVREKEIHFYKSLLNRGVSVGQLIAAFAVTILVGGAMIVFLGRSGNYFILPVTGLEDRLRLFLERSLIIRPRLKEFGIGHPSMILFIALASRGVRRYLSPIAVMGMIGQVSIVNTFAHIHTPIVISVIRTIYGAAIAIPIGILLVAVYLCIARRIESLKLGMDI